MMALVLSLTYIIGRLIYESIQASRAEKYAQEELRKFKERNGWL